MMWLFVLIFWYRWFRSRSRIWRRFWYRWAWTNSWRREGEKEERRYNHEKLLYITEVCCWHSFQCFPRMLSSWHKISNNCNLGVCVMVCMRGFNSVSTILCVPTWRRGTDCICSIGGFCRWNQRNTQLYSHSCSTDGTNCHNMVPTTI